MSKITYPNCGCDYETSAVPSVKVQEEKRHDAIGRSVHEAGNVVMRTCDTCRLPTRNLLEIGSIPNVTTGQPQRVFMEWPSSHIPVPTVPVQDALTTQLQARADWYRSAAKLVDQLPDDGDGGDPTQDYVMSGDMAKDAAEDLDRAVAALRRAAGDKL